MKKRDTVKSKLEERAKLIIDKGSKEEIKKGINFWKFQKGRNTNLWKKLN